MKVIIEKVVANDSIKDTSPAEKGSGKTMHKPANARELYEYGWADIIIPTEYIMSIIALRTTDGLNPTKNI